MATEPHPVCSDPACFEHGIAASNRRQSEFYATHDRTIPARPDDLVECNDTPHGAADCGHPENHWPRQDPMSGSPAVGSVGPFAESELPVLCDERGERCCGTPACLNAGRWKSDPTAMPDDVRCQCANPDHDHAGIQAHAPDAGDVALAAVLAEHRPNVVTEARRDPATGDYFVTRVKCDGETCHFYREGPRYWSVMDEHTAHLTDVLAVRLDAARAEAWDEGARRMAHRYSPAWEPDQDVMNLNPYRAARIAGES